MYTAFNCSLDSERQVCIASDTHPGAAAQKLKTLPYQYGVLAERRQGMHTRRLF